MKVERLRINHLKNPLGFALKTVTASYQVTQASGSRQETARIRVSLDPEGKGEVYDTGRADWVSGLGTRLPLSLSPCTRYYWKVWVWDNAGDVGESETAWFETGRMELGLEGISISADLKEGIPVLEKDFSLEEECTRARLYLCGLGVFEAYLNGKRIGDEVLTPYLTSYESHIQYLTFDVGKELCKGENLLQIYLAPGWYMGSYGYRQNPDRTKGRIPELMLTLDMFFRDGRKKTVVSDLSWKYRLSPIVYSDIYNGEKRDDTLLSQEEKAFFRENPGAYGPARSVKPGKLCPERKQFEKEQPENEQLENKQPREEPSERIQARRSVPVRVKAVLKPAALLLTPKGELVLDMGQNITGRITFRCRGKRGDTFVFTHGEILQKGNFYRENYRTARAEYIYVSDGEEKKVFPRFTFYGFRYVKITDEKGDIPKGIENGDFTGEVLTSQIEETASLQTGNALLNQLISNIRWSQWDNFLDVPTDCPQRDERLGWMGDAQIFAKTACINGECYAFYRKYLYDVWMEQKRCGGMAPQIVPSVDKSPKTSAAWGDAAVILPWVLYETYGDASILEEQWESMKQWAAYIDRCNARAGTNPYLWQNGFHYGDWLALDGGCYHMPVGGTDTFFLSSAYFYRTVKILSLAAKALDKREEEKHYAQKADKIKNAIWETYFTRSGRLCMDTQTGYAVALQFGLYWGEDHKKLLAEGLEKRIRMDGYRMKTGFVGTPLLLPALAQAGLEKTALRLLMQEDCPGWLYQVKLGATTVWERWDSVRPDGTMSDTGMNSLNHYANGSVLEWMYGWIGGIRQLPGDAGYGNVLINPLVCREIGHAFMVFDTAQGRYEIQWELRDGDILYLRCVIPFGAKARIRFPYAGEEMLRQYGESVERKAGEYEFCYALNPQFEDRPSLKDSVRWLVKNPKIKRYLYERVPMLAKVDGARIQDMTLQELSRLPFFLGIGTKIGLDEKTLQEIEEFLKAL